MQARYLLAAGLFVAVTSYAIRVVAPLGEEVIEDIYLAQAPAWVTGFTLGIVGAERGWFDRISPATVLATRYVSWPPEIEFPAAAALAVIVSFGIGALLVRIPGVSRIV